MGPFDGDLPAMATNVPVADSVFIEEMDVVNQVRDVNMIQEIDERIVESNLNTQEALHGHIEKRISESKKYAEEQIMLSQKNSERVINLLHSEVRNIRDEIRKNETNREISFSREFSLMEQRIGEIENNGKLNKKPSPTSSINLISDAIDEDVQTVMRGFGSGKYYSEPKKTSAKLEAETDLKDFKEFGRPIGTRSPEKIEPRVNLDDVRMRNGKEDNDEKIRLVKTCSYYGKDEEPDDEYLTHEPHFTKTFSCSVNLLCFVKVQKKFKFACAIRPGDAKIFPFCIDFTASGYVLPNENNLEAMSRVIYKELRITVDRITLSEIKLLDWLPNSDNTRRNLRYSKGILFFCQLERLPLDRKNFTLVDASEALGHEIDYKPELYGLLSDVYAVGRIFAEMYKLSKRNDNNYDEENNLDRSRSVNVDFPSMQRVPSVFDQHETFNRSTSVYRNASRSVPTSVRRKDNFDNELLMEEYTSRRLRDNDSYEDYTRRNTPMINIPNDRVQPRRELGHLEPNRIYIEQQPEDKNIFLNVIELSTVLKFCFKFTEFQKQSKDVQKMSKVISNTCIIQLEEAAISAKLEYGYDLLPTGTILSHGFQTCFNDEIYMCIAYELMPRNLQQMIKGLEVDVWPKTKTDFTVLKNYEDHFLEFLRAVFVYVQRYKDKKKLLVFFKESRKFYPETLWPHKQRPGEVTYFINGFPIPKIIKRINLEIPMDQLKQIETLDKYMTVIQEELRKAEVHFRVERGKYNAIYTSPITSTYNANKSNTNNNNRKFFNKGKYDRRKEDQDVNVVQEELEQVDDYHTGDEGDGDNDSDVEEDLNIDDTYDDDDVQSSIDEQGSLDESDSEQNDNINMTSDHKGKPSYQVEGKNICFEMANKGICKKQGCEYSHDKILVEKFKKMREEQKAKRKVSFGNNNAFNKTNNSKLPSGMLRVK